MDQNAFLPGKDGRVCVQGLVTLTDATAATGGLLTYRFSLPQYATVQVLVILYFSGAFIEFC